MEQPGAGLCRTINPSGQSGRPDEAREPQEACRQPAGTPAPWRPPATHINTRSRSALNPGGAGIMTQSKVPCHRRGAEAPQRSDCPTVGGGQPPGPGSAVHAPGSRLPGVSSATMVTWEKGEPRAQSSGADEEGVAPRGPATQPGCHQGPDRGQLASTPTPLHCTGSLFPQSEHMSSGGWTHPGDTESIFILFICSYPCLARKLRGGF